MGDLGRRLIRGDIDDELEVVENLDGRQERRELAAAVPAASALSTIPKQDPAELTGFSFIIDGGGATITTGEKGHVEIPFGAVIQEVRLLADQSGSIVVDIWKDNFANFPPAVADSITASAKPTISSATKSEDKTLVGWKTGLQKGDILTFKVDSITTCKRVTVALTLSSQAI